MIHPLPLLIAYYAIGLVLAVFGPVRYLDIDGPALLSYVGSFIVLFGLGFSMGSYGRSRRRGLDARAQRVVSLFPLLLTTAFFALSISVVYAVATRGLSALSLSAGAQNYADIYADYTRNSGSYDLKWLLGEAIYPVIIATIAWTIYYFSALRRIPKVVAALTILLVLLNFGIMAGKQKIIGDVLIITTFVLLAVWQVRRPRLSSKVAALVLLSVGIVIILQMLASRYELAGIDISNINEKSTIEQQYDENSSLLTIFGPRIGLSIMQLSGYLTNGYYGLSLAFELPFEWTYGIGNSYSAMVIYDRFLGGEFLIDKTYPFRVGLAHEWGLNKWHSAFAWYASDFTFTGTLFFFALVSFLYGRSWRAVTKAKNYRAVPIYAYLSIGFIFIPANNQLLISPGGILTLFLFLLFWLWPVRGLARAVPRSKTWPQQRGEPAGHSR